MALSMSDAIKELYERSQNAHSRKEAKKYMEEARRLVAYQNMMAQQNVSNAGIGSGLGGTITGRTQTSNQSTRSKTNDEILLERVHFLEELLDYFTASDPRIRRMVTGFKAMKRLKGE